MHIPRFSISFILLLPLFLLALLLIFFSITTPIAVGPIGVLLVMLLIYTFFVSLIFVVIRTIAWISFKLSHAKIRQISMQKSYYLASVLGFAPTMLIALQSVGQLKLRDIALVGLFIGLAFVYVMRRG